MGGLGTEREEGVFCEGVEFGGGEGEVADVSDDAVDSLFGGVL